MKDGERALEISLICRQRSSIDRSIENLDGKETLACPPTSKQLHTPRLLYAFPINPFKVRVAKTSTIISLSPDFFQIKNQKYFICSKIGKKIFLFLQKASIAEFLINTTGN